MTFIQGNPLRAVHVLYLVALLTLASSVNANESSIQLGRDQAISVSASSNSIYVSTDQESKSRFSHYWDGRWGNENDPFKNDPFENIKDIKTEESSMIKRLGKIVAYVVSAGIFVIISCVICCCCCPILCCKRKKKPRQMITIEVQQPQNPNSSLPQRRNEYQNQYNQQISSQLPYPISGGSQLPVAFSANGQQPQETSQKIAFDKPPPYPGLPVQPNIQLQSVYPIQAGIRNSEYQQQPPFNPDVP